MDAQNEIMTGDSLIEIIENQIEDGEPLKVKETLMRLMMTGHSRAEAVELMACALSVEVYDVAKNDAPFDHDRYKRNLDLLPDMPWAEDE
ncbi:hypothetical protein VST7929_01614 [Vibrio stylophorae]|uniref:Uncharacterized protein n=1 Tax=Vibrio stylophorae TaxID=659351 RepID=A0ABM8ZTU6_9VIBR|nr:hypothetical protein [Vibrio stylophorae]CAH0533739.1 hypothetical protein VST7929_01614 [Vibrio stylophorae]